MRFSLPNKKFFSVVELGGVKAGCTEFSAPVVVEVDGQQFRLHYKFFPRSQTGPDSQLVIPDSFKGYLKGCGFSDGDLDESAYRLASALSDMGVC